MCNMARKIEAIILAERLNFTFKFFLEIKKYVNLVCMIVIWSKKAIVVFRIFFLPYLIFLIFNNFYNNRFFFLSYIF